MKLAVFTACFIAILALIGYITTIILHEKEFYRAEQERSITCNQDRD